MLTSEIVGITELSQSHWCEPQPSFAGWVSQPSCKKPISWVKNETQNWIWSFNLASNCYNLLLLSLCWLSLLHCSSGFLPSPTVHASLSTLCSRILSLSLSSICTVIQFWSLVLPGKKWCFEWEKKKIRRGAVGVLTDKTSAYFGVFLKVFSRMWSRDSIWRKQKDFPSVVMRVLLGAFFV